MCPVWLNFVAKHGFFLMVDEAHAVGALGPGGRGLCAGVPGTADIVLGTFGKSLGLFGSFLLLPKGFAAFFESLSSAVMHSTAMPPAHAAAVLKLLERLPLLEGERAGFGTTPCFFAPACPSLGSLHAVPPILLRYLQAGKQGQPTLGNSWRKGACWHWRPAILRFPTATVCSGLGSPPCIRMACWNGRPASLRICGGKHTEEMAVSVSDSQKMNGYYSIIMLA